MMHEVEEREGQKWGRVSDEETYMTANYPQFFNDLIRSMTNHRQRPDEYLHRSPEPVTQNDLGDTLLILETSCRPGGFVRFDNGFVRQSSRFSELRKGGGIHTTYR